MSHTHHSVTKRSVMRWRSLAVCLLMSLMLISVAAAPLALASNPAARTKVRDQPIPNGPILLRSGITLRKVASVPEGSVKIARNPVNGQVFVLNPNEGLLRVEVSTPSSITKVVSASDIVTKSVLSGMAFGPDGVLYTVSNLTVNDHYNQAIIRKGVASSTGAFTWSTVMTTEPYPMSNTQFDHLWNGITVSPDNKWIYLNSGSRTDHGEIEDSKGTFPNTREVAMSAKVFRIPRASVNLVLPNDDKKLSAKGYIYARGTRNAFDLAIAPNGDLFGVDNGPDADLPDELNWLRAGRHYGFPWRFGTTDNPQRAANYDSSKDLRLNQDFFAVKSGLYRNDPTYPKAPGVFTNPVTNLGPDGAQYRGVDGAQHDAPTEKKPATTFTPHRSPLGLVFLGNPKMPADLRGARDNFGAFVLSWGSAGGTLTDKGQDLLHLQLRKSGDNYKAVTNQIVTNFKNPISAIVIDNRLYVLEWAKDSVVWELTFQ